MRRRVSIVGPRSAGRALGEMRDQGMRGSAGRAGGGIRRGVEAFREAGGRLDSDRCMGKRGALGASREREIRA